MKNIITNILLMLSVVVFSQSSFTLEEAIDYTLKNNYEILKSDLEIKKAEKKIWETTAIGLPHIDAGVDYNYNIDVPVAVFQGNVIPLGSKQSLAGNIQATQLLFNGSYIVGLQSARAFKEISNLAKEKTEAELKKAVTNAYSAVVIADENIKILNKNLINAEKNIKEIKALFDTGFVEEQTVDQINFTLTQLKASNKFAARQRERALNTLKFIMGVEQNQNLLLSTDLESLMLDNLQLLDTPLTAEIASHIDYKIANHQVKISELQVKYQKTMALPSLNTFFSHSQNNFSQDKSIFSGFDSWNPATVWGVKLSIPIFSSLQRHAKTQQAQIDLESSEIERKKKEQELIQQVKNAKIAFESALDNYYTASDLVKLSDKIYKKEKTKYFEGLSSSMDLTKTEEQLYNAENQYIQTAFDVIEAKTELYQALGKY